MSKRLTVCFLSSFPPRKCGIAIFTGSLVKSLSRLLNRNSLSILAVETDNIGGYGFEVRLRIKRDRLEDYRRAAEYVNRSSVNILHLQHEFGLFGGRWGNYILELLEILDKPIVTTFHTVLPSPEPELWSVVRGIAGLSSYVVVMARKAVDILVKDYGLPRGKLKLIPHGCPEVPLLPSKVFKHKLGFDGRIVLSTFGLISRNKGIEYAIEALPQLIMEEPRLLYWIAGETHPEVRKLEGESYRQELLNLVEKLGLKEHVLFQNRYLNDEELILLLQATDIYLTPYRSRYQITSGTLTYAMGAGRAVVSTPYPYALELLAGGRGLLCEFESPDSIASAVKKILKDKQLKRSLEVKAYEYARGMVWPVVAEKHVGLYETLLKS